MSKRRGVTIATVLLVLAIMFTIGGAMVAIGLQSFNVVTAGTLDRQAYFAANAGIENTLLQLESNPHFSVGFANVVLPNNGGSFSVQVWNNVLGTMPAVPAPPPGISVPFQCVYALSTGTDPSGKTNRQIGALLKQQTMFSFGLFAQGGLNLGVNSTVDGFNSSGQNGAASAIYASENPNTFAPQVAVGSNTDVAGTIAGTSAGINGNAQVGPGPVAPAQAITSGFQNGGTGSQLPKQVKLPPVTLPQGIADSGTLTPSNPPGGLTSAGSPYYFSGGAVFSGNGSVVVHNTGGGPILVYFDGTLDVHGAPGMGINSTGKPTDLVMLGTPNATSIVVGGNGQIVAGVYAPNATVTGQGGGNSGAVYGNLVAASYNVNAHVQFHEDLALAQLPLGGGFNTTAWYRF